MRQKTLASLHGSVSLEALYARRPFLEDKDPALVFEAALFGALQEDPLSLRALRQHFFDFKKEHNRLQQILDLLSLHQDPALHSFFIKLLDHATWRQKALAHLMRETGQNYGFDKAAWKAFFKSSEGADSN